MKKISIVSLFVLFGLSAMARIPSVEPTDKDPSQCHAIQIVLKSMVKTYVSENLSCKSDSDCSEVNLNMISRGCGFMRTVNKVGQKGFDLLITSPEFKRLYKLLRGKYCGPRPVCAQRIPGTVKCVQFSRGPGHSAGLCRYVPNER